jgi:hypothetical protein
MGERRRNEACDGTAGAFPKRLAAWSMRSFGNPELQGVERETEKA